MNHYRKGGRVKKNKSNKNKSKSFKNTNTNKNNIIIHNNITSNESQEKSKIEKNNRLYGIPMHGTIGNLPNIQSDIREPKPRQPIQLIIPGKDQQIPIQNNNIHGGNIMDLEPNKTTSSLSLFDELNDIESVESLKVNEDDEDIGQNAATSITPIKQNKDSIKVRDFFNSLDDPTLYFNQNGRSNLNAMLEYFNMNRTGRDSRKIYRDIAYRIGDL